VGLQIQLAEANELLLEKEKEVTFLKKLLENSKKDKIQL
jgi:hypothetical protein